MRCECDLNGLIASWTLVDAGQKQLVKPHPPTRHLLDQGISVVEVVRPNRQIRRRHDKTDAIDAETAARSVLAGTALGLRDGLRSGDVYVPGSRRYADPASFLLTPQAWAPQKVGRRYGFQSACIRSVAGMS